MYFALYAEKWLSGSTRLELLPDERACFVDILARATVTGADPPGVIFFYNEEQLAVELRDPLELVQRTLKKCQDFKKIKIQEKRKEHIRVLTVVNWENYQHFYLHQKAYRQRQRELKEKQRAGAKNANSKEVGDTPDIACDVDRRGEGKGIDLNKGTKGKEADTNSSVNPYKRNFLKLLEDLSRDSNTPYPFDLMKDETLFEQARRECPNTNLISELEKKFDYWKRKRCEHPMIPDKARRQLLAWFAKEEEYQKEQHGLVSSGEPTAIEAPKGRQ